MPWMRPLVLPCIWGIFSTSKLYPLYRMKWMLSWTHVDHGWKRCLWLLLNSGGNLKCKLKHKDWSCAKIRCSHLKVKAKEGSNIFAWASTALHGVKDCQAYLKERAWPGNDIWCKDVHKAMNALEMFMSISSCSCISICFGLLYTI